jgi:cell division transport system permease protein
VTKRLATYLLRHAQVFFYSLGQLARTPFASLLTIAVIGITLALPVGLYLILTNLERVSGGWEGPGQISLFLRRDTNEANAVQLQIKIRNFPSVSKVDYLSPDAALAEFKRLSGFGEALSALNRNPLPPVLLVYPSAQQIQPNSLEDLRRKLEDFDEVELAQLDLEWVNRLQALLALARRSVILLTALLGLAVVLIIGNTIRLAVINRREEVSIIKLVGGTHAFIRRPFLYAGLQQGALGALVSVCLVRLTLLLLSEPVADLAILYGSSFRLMGLNLTAAGALLIVGGILGWIGSWVAVSRHLRATDPI